MADFALSKSLFSGKYRNGSSTPAILPMRCLCCFAFGLAQLLNLLVHAPGVYERLMQVQEQAAHGWKLVSVSAPVSGYPVFSWLPHFCSGGAMAALATSPPVRFTLPDAA